MELGEIRPEGIEVRCEAGRNLSGGLVALDGKGASCGGRVRGVCAGGRGCGILVR